MNIEKVKEFAATIKHCGDYGELWINREKNLVYWVGGDADFDEDDVENGFCTDWNEIISGFKKAGAADVMIEAECGPYPEDSWENLGNFGIDNWNEKAHYEKQGIDRY